MASLINEELGNECVECINQAKLSQSIEERLTLLAQAQEILLHRERTGLLLLQLSQNLAEMMFDGEHGSKPKIRVFIIEFIEEAIIMKPSLCVTLLPNLLFLLRMIETGVGKSNNFTVSAGNHAVLKQILITLCNTFRKTLTFLVDQTQDPPKREIKEFADVFHKLRTEASSMINHENDAIRVSAIKFVQVQALCFLSPESNSNTNSNNNNNNNERQLGEGNRPDSFTLQDIPRSHPVLFAAELELEATKLVKSSCDNLLDKSKPMYAQGTPTFTMTVNSLTILAVHRPSTRQFIVPKMISCHRTIFDSIPDKNDLGTAPVDAKKALQTLKTNMLTILRSVVGTDFQSQLSKCLDNLGANQSASAIIKKEEDVKKRISKGAKAPEVKRLSVSEIRDWGEALALHRYPPMQNSFPTEGLHLEPPERIIELIFLNARNLPPPPQGWVKPSTNSNRGAGLLNHLFDLLQGNTEEAYRLHIPDVVHKAVATLVEISPSDALLQRKAGLERILRNTESLLLSVDAASAVASMNMQAVASSTINNPTSNTGMDVVVDADSLSVEKNLLANSSKPSAILTTAAFISQARTGFCAAVVARIACDFIAPLNSSASELIDLRPQVWEWVAQDLGTRNAVALLALHREYASDVMNADHQDTKSSSRYEFSFRKLLERIELNLKPNAKALAKFFVDVPKFPKSGLAFTLHLCEDPDSRVLGLGTLHDLAILRPGVSDICIKCVCWYAVCFNHQIRESAIRLAASKLFKVSRFSSQLKIFATAMLETLTSNNSSSITTAATTTVEAPDRALRLDIQEILKEYNRILTSKKAKEAAVEEAQKLEATVVSSTGAETSRRLQLFLALCATENSLLRKVLDIYAQIESNRIPIVDVEVINLVEKLLPSIDVQGVMTLLQDFPPGCENLILKIIGKCAKYRKDDGGTKGVTQALLDYVRTLRCGGESILEKDLRFVIPVISLISRAELFGGTPEHPTGMISRISKLDTSDIETALANVLGASPPIISPTDFLIQLCTLPITELKSIVLLTNLIFGMNNQKTDKKKSEKPLLIYFNEKILADVLRNLIDRAELPKILLRLMMMAVETFPKLKTQALTFIERLAKREIWTTDDVGFFLCAYKLRPESFSTIVNLPAAQVGNFLESYPNTKPLLKNYVDSNEKLRMLISEDVMSLLRS